MLHLVRGNTPYTVILLFIITLLLKLQMLGDAVMPLADVHHALYGQIIGGLKHTLGAGPVFFAVLALLMTFGQALYLRFITIRHRLLLKVGYLPAFAFIVFSSLHPAMGAFSPQLLVNWFVLAGLDASLHFWKREEQTRIIFNAGFMLGCAALLHFPALVFLLFPVLALTLLRAFKPGEWVGTMLGYLTPAYFTVALLYLFDGLGYIPHWPAIGLALARPMPRGAYLPVVVAGCILLTAAGLASLMQVIEKMPVSIRRSWGAIAGLLVLSVVMCIATPKGESAAWAGMLPAMSLVAVPPMAREKRSRRANFTFYFLIVLVVFAQLALRR